MPRNVVLTAGAAALVPPEAETATPTATSTADAPRAANSRRGACVTRNLSGIEWEPQRGEPSRPRGSPRSSPGSVSLTARRTGIGAVCGRPLGPLEGLASLELQHLHGDDPLTR